ncbi:uncharacterized protein [Littorina saxatilis]
MSISNFTDISSNSFSRHRGTHFFGNMKYFALALIALIPACLGQQHQCLQPDFVAHVMFVESDKDNDAVLHLTELIDVFDVYDANNDTKVSRHEYVKYQTENDPELDGISNALYNVYDFNNDHHLTLDDYVAFYRSMDADKDDSVTEPEFKTYWVQLFNSVKHHGHQIC